MRIKTILSIFIISQAFSSLIAKENITVDELLAAIDRNLHAKSQVYTSKMIVHGRRSSRTIASRMRTLPRGRRKVCTSSATI